MNQKRSLFFYYIAAVSFVIALLTFQSCKKPKSDIGKAVFKATKNKIFKDIDANVFEERFTEALEQKRTSFKNPKFMSSFYEQANYEPVIVLKNVGDQGLKKSVEILSKSEDHGIDPQQFQAAKLSELTTKLYEKNAVKSLDDAYALLIDLELTLANSVSNYSNAIQFGLVSPRKIYAQYYIPVKRPDSLSFQKPFESKNLVSYLDSIQPKDQKYTELQQALKTNMVIPGLDADDSKKVLKVALERQRWKEFQNADRYVYVNIPDFYLDVMEKGKSILNMKVCVGEGRENGNKALISYDEGLQKDRPFNRETPQLSSEIHSVQVNPVWNIPESIASNEIMKYAAADKHYLSNEAIDVYQDGKKVEDPETIDWSTASAKVYSFKQRPGADNSLGKIKFLFNNQSSVYLHDTPAKGAFKLNNRAVSHGCVRVERPADLAKALFGEGKKLNEIEKQMASTTPEAEDIALDRKVPVYLTYRTCWVDDSGKIQYRKDIYGLDAVLYSYLNKMGS